MVTYLELERELKKAREEHMRAFTEYIEHPNKKTAKRFEDALLNLQVVLQMQCRDLHEGLVKFD